MLYADYHLHSNFSADCQTAMIDMIEQAIQLGMKEIAFTDHIDLKYPYKNLTYYYEYKDYRNMIEECRDIYRNKIRFILGVELGLQTQDADAINALIEENEYDFIIGSSHRVNGVSISKPDFFEGKSCHAAYQEYFEYVLKCIETFDCFNVYGHLDYISRYGTEPLQYKEYVDIIDEILKKLIEKKKGLEINTSGYRYGINATHPSIPILNRYQQLGGEIVTIG